MFISTILFDLYYIVYIPFITIINYYKMIIFKKYFPIKKFKNIVKKHNSFNNLLKILTIKKRELNSVYIRPDNPYYDKIYNKRVVGDILDFISYMPYKNINIRLHNKPSKREIEEKHKQIIETQKLLNILSFPKLQNVHININTKNYINIEKLKQLRFNISLIPFPKSFIPKNSYDIKDYDGDYILNDWSITCKDFIDIFGNPGPIVCSYFVIENEQQYLDDWRDDYYKKHPSEKPPTKSFKDMLLSV